MSGNWNEYNLNILTRIHWRASLVLIADARNSPVLTRASLRLIESGAKLIKLLETIATSSN